MYVPSNDHAKSSPWYLGTSTESPHLLHADTLPGALREGEDVMLKGGIFLLSIGSAGYPTLRHELVGIRERPLIVV